MDDLNQPHNALVELVKFVGRHPQLEDVAPANLPDRVTGCKLPVDLDPGDVADARSGHVPVPGNHDRLLLAQDRVEDRLIRQPRRPRPPAGGTHKVKLLGPLGRHRVIASLTALSFPVEAGYRQVLSRGQQFPSAKATGVREDRYCVIETDIARRLELWCNVTPQITGRARSPTYAASGKGINPLGRSANRDRVIRVEVILAETVWRSRDTEGILFAVIVVQRIRVRWGADARGAMHANRRRSIPDAYPLPGSAAHEGFLVHEVLADDDADYQPFFQMGFDAEAVHAAGLDPTPLG